MATVYGLLAISFTACTTDPEINRSEAKSSKEAQRVGVIRNPTRKLELLVLKQVILGGQLAFHIQAAIEKLDSEGR